MRLPSCFICNRPVLWEHSLCNRCDPSLDEQIERDLRAKPLLRPCVALLILTFWAFLAAVFFLKADQ